MNQPSHPSRVPHPHSDLNSTGTSHRSQGHDGNDPEDALQNKFLFFNAMPSWMVSFLTHIAVIIVLAIIIMPSKKELVVEFEGVEPTAAPVESKEMVFEPLDDDKELIDSNIPEDAPSPLSDLEDFILPEPTNDFTGLTGAIDSLIDIPGDEPFSGTANGNELDGRRPENIIKTIGPKGPSPQSLESIDLALKWIVDHQLPDGGWNMDHTVGPGNHRTSPDPGNASQARAGATALALLPLLGYGNTHKSGTYKNQVEAGLKFLMANGKPVGRGVSYLEPGGTMYSHGLVSIVFCEAFAMTKDPYPKPFAQGTIWFIEDAQDPNGGGWRYQPRQAGDTSAVGWQLMALKSAKIGGLEINPKTLKLTEKFLDSVSIDSGAFYGYTAPPARPVADARTAVGLLCRMYMGWEKDAPGIVDGTELMSKKGPDIDNTPDAYYNYYASQVMKHMGGRQWKDWNPPMRDSLVATQDKKGVSAGSWTPGAGHADKAGGRLYVTAMNCMTLEVPFRYLPLYGDKAADDEFRLE